MLNGNDGKGGYKGGGHNVERINKEMIVAEILQALAGSLGILLTLPLTSATCAVIYYKIGEEKKNASC